jgi:hypothetical protein
MRRHNYEWERRMTEETRSDRTPAAAHAEHAASLDPTPPDESTGTLLRFPPPGRHRRATRRPWLARVLKILPGDDDGGRAA